MRYLVLTDIHGNLEALNAVLKTAARKKTDRTLCLGDLVGYGASPNEVVQKIHGLKPLSIIRGNHDKAVCDLDTIQTFNPIAAAAIEWAKTHIQKRNLEILTALPRGPEIVDDDVSICHGAPFDEDYYIFGEGDAMEAFDYFRTPVCFFGHTHFPFVYARQDHSAEGTLIEGDATEVKLEKDIAYLINPGSVGQPRDRNSKAAFAVYDSQTRIVKFYRVDYEIETTQDKILKAGLPSALAERLSLGI